jgi:predicted transposase YbfD/YdcC
MQMTIRETRRSLVEYFEQLPDSRQQGKTLYPLTEIILTSVCAVLAGANSYVEIAHFGEIKLDFLRKLLPFRYGIPSHDTLGVVFAAIDTKIFNQIFIDWVTSLQESIPEIVAIDGKTVRRSRDGDKKPIHVVSAWASKQKMVVGQVKTDEKSNEITAIPELLNMLVLKGAIVTIDAMGCQTKILETIVGKKADYVVTLKENQPKLYKDISLYFEGVLSQTLSCPLSTHKNVDKGHGRIETRTYSITEDISWLDSAQKWPGLKSIGCVQSERITGDKTTYDTRYFISSLPADAEVFATAVRGHWGIENSLHWVMDVVFRDDDCRIRKRHGPANFVIIKHITQNMLKTVPGNQSMRVRRKMAGWDNDFLMSALTAKAC